MDKDDLPLRLQILRGIPSRPDAGGGLLLQAQVTLGLANVITTITVPSWVRGFRLSEASADILFAVDEDPAALAAASGPAIDAAAAFGVGGVVDTAAVLDRFIASEVNDVPRTLRLRSATASATVIVQLHG